MTVLLISIKKAPSGGANVYINGKRVMSGQGTIKYPIAGGSHMATFDATGNQGEEYSIFIAKQGGGVIWDIDGTLPQQGTATAQQPFTI